MKAIIFSRVSSKEQEDGYSIAAQSAKLKDYCLRKGLDVLRVFEVTESSTTGSRKQFKDMLAFTKVTRTQSSERIAIVVDAVDRLMRNFTEQPILNDLMNQDIVELHFAKDGSVIHKDSTSTEKLFWNFQIMMAQSYVDSLKDNVKRSIDYKIKKGEYPSKAPMGYLNVPKQQRQGVDIVLDEARCFLIKRLFQEYATGTYTLRDMAELAKKWGLRSRSGKALGTSMVHYILQDPFYVGHMRIKGQPYPHCYPKLVEEEIFIKCQQVRESANKKPFRYAEKPFLFRGLIKCKHCGCAYTSYMKKGRYTYLKPTKSKGKCLVCKPMREEVALKQVETVFRSIQIPEHLLGQIGEHLRMSQNAKQSYQDKMIAELRKEYDGIRRRQSRLLDLLIDKSITQSIYDTKLRELTQRREEIDKTLAGHTKADETFYHTLAALLELSSKAYECFSRAHMEQQRKLISFILANLQMDGETLCFTMRKPFDVLAKLPQSAEWRARQESNLRQPV